MTTHTREIWDDDIDFLINDAPGDAIKGIDYESMVTSGANYPSSDPTILRLHGKVASITRARGILKWWLLVPLHHRQVLGDPECQDKWGYYTRRNVWPVGAAVEFGALTGAAFAVELDRDKLVDACSRRGRTDAREYLSAVRSRAKNAVLEAHMVCREAKQASFESVRRIREAMA